MQSKTVIGLLILLGVVVGLSLAGKLTPEAVDALKWLGTSYMAVRTAANVAENLPGNNKNG
jgi:threonine/homoserine/homoserine lactone efflux protein